jgi:hypothetical protein
LESYKEALNNKVNCLRRLAASGVYEAAGNAFWLKLASLLAWEGGGTVLGSEISWTQLGVGRLFWSEEKFKRSADTWNLRQYNVHCSFFFLQRFRLQPSPLATRSRVSLASLDVRCSWGGGPTWMTSFELTTRQ